MSRFEWVVTDVGLLVADGGASGRASGPGADGLAVQLRRHSDRRERGAGHQPRRPAPPDVAHCTAHIIRCGTAMEGHGLVLWCHLCDCVLELLERQRLRGGGTVGCPFFPSATPSPAESSLSTVADIWHHGIRNYFNTRSWPPPAAKQTQAD